MKKVKKAFSLIEVVFVLVILGVVASISSQIIVQVYENYIMQKAVYNVSTKTELVVNQIVNRLRYRIQGTTMARNPNNNSSWKLLKNLDVSTDKNLTVMEWIGYDNDSFSAGQTPYWSGVANYELNNIILNGLNTLGSSLSDADNIINNLSNNQVGFSKPNQPAIIFDPITGADENLTHPMCMGMINDIVDNGSNNCIFPVSRSGESTLTFASDTNETNFNQLVSERYKLAWSAYALVPVDNPPLGDKLFDLFLHYNYQPWENEQYNEGNSIKKLLIKDISVFKFTENGGTIQLKLCAKERISKNFYISACKEKVVIR